VFWLGSPIATSSVDDRRLLDTEHSDPDGAVELIASEFRHGFELVAQIDRPAVAMFGSARASRRHPAYAAARAVGRGFAERGWAVVTGGGPGLMEAANRGAQEAGGLSVGFNISLPHEQVSNRYLDISYTFQHFYARKVCFVKPAEGFVIFPGGYGTLNELYEALTLIQTGTVLHFPVVLYERTFWSEMLDWLRARLIPGGMIGGGDLDILKVADEPEEAVEYILDAYGRRFNAVAE
jgi:uncharacterized protein (TIGR00730 family)